MRDSRSYKVGVFPCGSEVGLEIHSALRYSRHFSLIGLSSTQDKGHLVYETYFGNLPFITDANFIQEIASFCKKAKLDFLIPAMDEVGFLLAQHQDEIECEIVYCSAESAKVIRRKSLTYEALKDIIPTPKVFKDLIEAQNNLPIFIKPDIGYGSRNVRLVKSQNELIEIWKSQNEFIYLEFLPGEEITVDCFSDVKNQIVICKPRLRTRIRMGISVASTHIEYDKVNSYAQNISEKLKLSGVWFFQMKKDTNDEYKLLEVATRVAGSMALTRVCGANLILAELFQRLGHTIQFNLIRKESYLERSLGSSIVVKCSIECIYVDLDDCLIIRDLVNAELLSFLFKKINEGVKIILLTRHKGDLNETLVNKRLQNVFDDIIHLKNPLQLKSEFVKNDKSIFIDDSFKERNDVSLRCQVPVFAPDVIPNLLLL